MLTKYMKSHKYVYGGRINWRSLTIAFTLAFCAFLGSYVDRDEVYIADKSEEVLMKPVVVQEPTMEDKIREYFPRNWKTMVAIAHAESHMDMQAKGYNCFYYHGKATTTPIKGGSKACKIEDRHLSYSVDCFILQRNYKGKECPSNVSLDQHLKEVAELSKVQNLNAWSSFNNGSYKRFLAEN
jgi:hypothetical protein